MSHATTHCQAINERYNAVECLKMPRNSDACKTIAGCMAKVKSVPTYVAREVVCDAHAHASSDTAQIPPATERQQG